MTEFDTSQPDVRTAAEWGAFARRRGLHGWRSGLRAYAVEHGRAVCFMDNDDALVLSRNAARSAGVEQRTIPRAQVRWKIASGRVL